MNEFIAGKCKRNKHQVVGKLASVNSFIAGQFFDAYQHRTQGNANMSSKCETKREKR